MLRGADLLSSTARQILLYRALGARPPVYAHVPLILGPDGVRLAKRHSGTSIREFRANGQTAEQVVGLLASTLGLVPPGTSVAPGALIPDFSLTSLQNEPTTLDQNHLSPIIEA